MPAPAILHAQVVSVDAARGAVYVMLPSGQVPGSYPARVAHYGPADALRVKQAPLPQPGTWGLVAFPGGDTRNAVWLCSYYPSQVDARTHPTDPNVDYQAHYGGGYDLLDGAGSRTTEYPDGTTITVSPDGSPIAPTRHIVDSSETQQVVASAASDRLPTPAPPLHVVVKTAGGVTISVTPGQGVSIDLPAGQVVSLTQGGAAASDELVLASKLVSVFNAHTHPDAQGGSTGTPTAPMTAASVETQVVKVSG